MVGAQVPVVLRFNEHHGVAVEVQIQPVRPAQAGDFVGLLNVAHHDGLQRVQPRFAGSRGRIVPCAKILVADAVQHFPQALRLQGHLQQIVVHAQVHGLVQVAELLVAGEDDDLDAQAVRLDLANQLDAVHHGYFDVRDQDLRLVFQAHLQRLVAVFRLAHQLVTAVFPVEAEPDAHAHQGLVLGNQYLNHGFSFSASAMGSVTRTVVP